MPSRVGLGTLKSLFINLVADRGAVEIQSYNSPAWNLLRNWGQYLNPRFEFETLEVLQDLKLRADVHSLSTCLRTSIAATPMVVPLLNIPSLPLHVNCLSSTILRYAGLLGCFDTFLLFMKFDTRYVCRISSSIGRFNTLEYFSLRFNRILSDVIPPLNNRNPKYIYTKTAIFRLDWWYRLQISSPHLPK